MLFQHDEAGRPRGRIAGMAVVVALLGTGAAVTATAAPGPSTDVKSAQYGTPGKPNPNAPSGKCATIAGPKAFTCQKYQNAYKKAKKACARKKTKKARAKCRKAVERKQGKKFRDYAAANQYHPPSS